MAQKVPFSCLVHRAHAEPLVVLTPRTLRATLCATQSNPNHNNKQINLSTCILCEACLGKPAVFTWQKSGQKRSDDVFVIAPPARPRNAAAQATPDRTCKHTTSKHQPDEILSQSRTHPEPPTPGRQVFVKHACHTTLCLV
jgi:hypothetical protein